MSRHFAAIAYTPGVRASQRRYGGRDLGEGLDNVTDTPTAELGPREQDFIAARDSFYLSTRTKTAGRMSSTAVAQPDFSRSWDRTHWPLPICPAIANTSASAT